MLATARPQQRRQDITPTKAGPEDTSGKAPHGARKAPPQSGARKRTRTDDDDGDVVDTPRSPACNKNSRGCEARSLDAAMNGRETSVTR